ncbi:hypothetical protein BURMUCF2_2284 [Burkholderia multivorans CF2]|nr:hypothetical protein BURMUCF2_2284 [Burkholderia multivorans CF2]
MLSRGGHGRVPPAGRGGSRHGKGSRVDRAGLAAGEAPAKGRIGAAKDGRRGRLSTGR